MNGDELREQAEEAHLKGEKAIGLTTAIVAVLLAVATLLGHRAHTEEIKLQTEVNDGWAFYQARHNRAHEYALHAEDSARAGATDIAMRDLRVAQEEECGYPADKTCAIPLVKRSPILQKLASQGLNQDEKEGQQAGRRDGAVDLLEKTREIEKETALTELRANHFDSAELFLEISIVLCAIALLAEAKVYWRLSFITSTIGIIVALFGWFAH